MEGLARRDFLRSALFAAGALALPPALAACGKDSPPGSTGAAGSLKELVDSRRNAGARDGRGIGLGGLDYIAGIENYVAFGMLDPSGARIEGHDATVWFAKGPGGGSPPIGPFPAPWIAYAKPEEDGPRGLNAITTRIPSAGPWQTITEVTASGATIVNYNGGAFQARAEGQPDAPPAPGARAIASATPTLEDRRGVNPICTRSPRCPFHRLTLKRALDAGKPVVFYVGTPKFCRSRTCGPNLEELIEVARDVGDRATFVHAEVYRNDDPDTIARNVVTKTFLEWKLQSEPWAFLVDRTGIVRARFEGPAAAATVREALTGLL